MSEYLGDFLHGKTINKKWATTAIAGESITRGTNGSIRIYKNDSTTQRSSAAGITDTEDFHTLTGVHHLKIDTGDDTDAGFYAPGNEYEAVLVGAVVDGKTINVPLFSWSIENRGEYKVVGRLEVAAGDLNEAELVAVPAAFQGNDRYNFYGIRIWHVDGTVEFAVVNDSVYASGAMTLHFDDLQAAAAAGDKIDVIMGAPASVLGPIDANVVQVLNDALKATKLGNILDQVPAGTVHATGLTVNSFQCDDFPTLGRMANLDGRSAYFRTGNLNFFEWVIDHIDDLGGGVYEFFPTVAFPVAPDADSEFEVMGSAG